MENNHSAILYGVPRVAYGQDGCTPFPMCILSCARYLGIPVDYARAMAESGAAGLGYLLLERRQCGCNPFL